jgi:hypothetical protein
MNNETLRDKGYKRLVADIMVHLPGLITALNRGAKTVLVTRSMAENLDKENLAIIGAVVKLCQLYEATVIFTEWTDRLIWVRSDSDSLP